MLEAKNSSSKSTWVGNMQGTNADNLHQVQQESGREQA